jgi:hypothetical protein
MYNLKQSKRRTAHDHLIRSLSEVFLDFEETRNTSRQYWTLHSAKILDITYDVGRFTYEGLLPFEEYIDTSLY